MISGVIVLKDSHYYYRIAKIANEIYYQACLVTVGWEEGSV